MRVRVRVRVRIRVGVRGQVVTDEGCRVEQEHVDLRTARARARARVRVPVRVPAPVRVRRRPAGHRSARPSPHRPTGQVGRARRYRASRRRPASRAVGRRRCSSGRPCWRALGPCLRQTPLPLSGRAERWCRPAGSRPRRRCRPVARARGAPPGTRRATARTRSACRPFAGSATSARR